MNTIKITKFGNLEDVEGMVKQLAESVNAIERVLQAFPIYYGSNSPKNSVSAEKGSLFVRTGEQGTNRAVAKPTLYYKTSDNGADGWLELIYFGTQAQTDVSAFRGSLYLRVPDELTASANLYLKQSNDAETNGWTAL